jgi:hypothetical protein
MKLKTTIVIVLILLKMGKAHAQLGIGISNPEPSAILDLSNLNKGLLIPRLTTSAAILNPANGLMYFNTTNNKVEVNEGNASVTDWKPVIGGTMGGIGTIGITGDNGPIGFTAQSPMNNTGPIGSTIAGGYNNTACGEYSTVVGGISNIACGDYSVIGGGSDNSTPALNSTIVGGTFNQATGINSFIGGGEFNLASGLNSSVTGGSTNQAMASNATIIGGKSNTIVIAAENGVINGGTNNNVNAIIATISGGDFNTANGVGSTVSGGSHNTAASYGEWVGGTYGTNYTPLSTSSFIATDRVFNVGNGTSEINRKDAFTILKNGLASLPSVTNTLITEGSSKAIVTKEYVLATYTKIKTNAPAFSGDFGVPGELRLTQFYIYSCISTNLWVRTPVAAW